MSTLRQNVADSQSVANAAADRGALLLPAASTWLEELKSSLSQQVAACSEKHWISDALFEAI
jgi:hypothetical protein